MPRTALVVVLLALAALLTACPGQTNQPPVGPAIVITSHQNGQVIRGSRDIQVVATVTGMQKIASHTSELNGAAVFDSLVGNVITASISLVDHTNVVTFIATSDGGTTVEAEITLDYPFVTLVQYQPAAFAIGQEDLTSVDELDDDEVIWGPGGRPALVGSRLYLPDSDYNRVMVYDPAPTVSGQAADFVLGQVSFLDNVGGEGAGKLHAPAGVAAAGGLLLVADGNNSRVLIWPTTPAAFGAPAGVALGQANFSTNNPNCTASGLDHPSNALIANGRLVVADTGNNRVLIWNAVPSSNAKAADVVIGQTDMESCAANGGGAVSGTTLNRPHDVYFDGQTLYVADTSNNRVLAYNGLPTTSGVGAALVLGQPDLLSSTPAPGGSGMFEPYSVHGNANQLFVADTGNNRVLVWNDRPTTNGAAADSVLGQSNLDDVTANAGDPGVIANGMGDPTGVLVTGDQVLVGDRLNRRYLVFQGAATAP